MAKIISIAKGIGKAILVTLLVKLACDIILPFLWSFLSGLGGGIISAYKNALVISASEVTSMTLPMMVMEIFIFTMIFIPIFPLKEIRRRKIKTRKIQAERMKPVEVAPAEDLHQDNEDNSKDLDKGLTKVKKFERVIYILFTVIIIWSVLAFAIILVPMSYNSKFEIAIDKAAPYMTDDEAELYKSRWRTMQNHEDYLAIMNEIDNVYMHNVVVTE